MQPSGRIRRDEARPRDPTIVDDDADAVVPRLRRDRLYLNPSPTKHRERAPSAQNR
jgi:hypothetical protein